MMVASKTINKSGSDAAMRFRFIRVSLLRDMILAFEISLVSLRARYYLAILFK